MSEVEAIEGTATAGEAVAEKKPVRRRTTRVKKTTDETPTSPESTDAKAEEKPKPARRTRAKKAEAAAGTAAANASGEPVEEKPKRRGRPRKVDIEAAASSEKKDATVAVEEKPVAKRRGRPRKVDVETAASSEKKDATANVAEEKPAAKRRGRTKETEKEEVAEASTSAQVSSSAKPAEAPKKETSTPEASVEASADESKDKQEGTEEKGHSPRRYDHREKRDSNDNSERGGKNKHDRNDRRNRRNKRNQKQEVTPSVTIEELAAMKVAELRAKAAEVELDVTGLKKAEMVPAVYAAVMKAEGFVSVEGILDILPDGYGFLRTTGYLPGEGDVYVGTSLVRRNNLRKGDHVSGTTRPMRDNEKYGALQKIEKVNGIPIAEMGPRVKFSDLTPVYPDERLVMEHGKSTITSRVIDLAAPIGKGQRGLIVSPPKAGKTTVLKDIAASITANNPEVHLMCLLVDERPEEVTDMQRSIKGEVISSTFDMPCENHIAVAELVIERAKRLVEMGQDVVILLDSLTRLARAYNLAQPASGRILSGGVDSTALYPPKKFLGAARNIENGGSLTILASALVDTGSKMDEVIFEEFKGTGNMELKLDRNLADRRIFPAIDPVASGTRKEDLLLDPQEAPLIWALRRFLSNMNNTERAMDMLIKSLKQTENNQIFLIRTAKKAQSAGKIDEI